MTKRDYRSYGVLDSEWEEQEVTPPSPTIKEERQVPPKDLEETSFTSYKERIPTQQQSYLTRGLIMLIKVVIFIMLLPFISIVACVMGGIVMVIVGSIIICILGGIFILGAICFISSQVSPGLVALGVTASVTLISLGLIFILLSQMFLKWLIKGFKKRRAEKNIGKRKRG